MSESEPAGTPRDPHGVDPADTPDPEATVGAEDAEATAGAEDAEGWGALLGDLGGDDWEAADAHARREERRRRFGGRALLIGLAVALVGGLWLAKPFVLSLTRDDAGPREPSLVLVSALADEQLWSPDGLAPRERALPALAVFALAREHRREPSSILARPLADAAARLLAADDEPARDPLVPLLRALALRAAGESLGDETLRTQGRELLATSLAALPPAPPGGRMARWTTLARAELEVPGEGAGRLALSEALGGPAVDQPVWQAATELLLERR